MSSFFIRIIPDVWKNLGYGKRTVKRYRPFHGQNFEDLDLGKAQRNLCILDKKFSGSYEGLSFFFFFRTKLPERLFK